jgi:hypothetical protein
MSTAQEIEKAIRSLPTSERAKLLKTIPHLSPELSGDIEWARIIGDERPRPDLTQVINETENEFRAHPEKFSKFSDRDFSSSA